MESTQPYSQQNVSFGGDVKLLVKFTNSLTHALCTGSRILGLLLRIGVGGGGGGGPGVVKEKAT